MAKLIREGGNVEDIVKAIKEEGVEQQIKDLSVSLLEQSIFYSNDIGIAKTPSDKVNLIAGLLNFTDRVASAERMDLLLRGSPLGPSSLTLIRLGNDVAPANFVPNGVQLSLSTRNLAPVCNSGIYFIPLFEKRTCDQIFSKYCAGITDMRNSINDPLEYFNRLNSNEFKGILPQYEVEIITGKLVVYFDNLPATINKPMMMWKDPYRNMQAVAHKDWSGGLKCMMDDLVIVRDFGFLPRTDWDKITEVARLLEQI